MNQRSNRPAPETPAELAERLRNVSASVVDQLLDPSSPDTLHALAMAVELVEVAGLSQREIIAAVRSQGVSWTTVGGVLGVTRQAAFQRFGQGTAKTPTPENVEYADAALVTAEVLAELRAGRWDAVIARCSGVIRADLGPDGLRQAWEITLDGADEVLEVDPAHVRRVGAVTVTETVMRTAKAEHLLRLTFNSEGMILGVWFDSPATRSCRAAGE